MKLNAYPQAIYQLQMQLLEAEAAHQNKLDILRCLDAENEQQIASDGELKNDTQRKSRRHELLPSGKRRNLDAVPR